MAQISRDSLLTLEAYAKQRGDFRARVIAHKKNRTVRLGEHMTLIFEDELTIRYQIQEMLRIEKTFEEAGIQDELVFEDQRHVFAQADRPVLLVGDHASAEVAALSCVGFERQQAVT